MATKTPTNRLNADEVLNKGDSIVSTNKKYKLFMQDDGNLVIYEIKEQTRAIWFTKTSIKGDRMRAALQGDGNFVIYDGDRGIWSTNTYGKFNPVLTMLDNGNLVMSSDGKEVWATNSTQRQGDIPVKARPDGLYVGQQMGRGHKLTAPNGKYYADFDGNLLRVRKQDGGELWKVGEPRGPGCDYVRIRNDGEIEMMQDVVGRERVRWSMNIAGRGNAESYLIMQNNGVLALMSDGKAVWETDTRREEDGSEPVTDRLRAGETLKRGKRLTSPNRKSELVYQSDGNLVLYTNGAPTWATKTDWEATVVEVRTNDNFAVGHRRGGDAWSSNTARRMDVGKAELILQDDGKLILKTDGYIIWSTDPGLVQSYPTQYKAVSSGVNHLKRGECLSVNQYMSSPNGMFTATLQSDGDLVIRHKTSLLPLWRSKTSPNNAVTKLAVQFDYNCVIIGANDSPVWHTGSNSNDSRDWLLVLNDEGVLGIKDWTSDSRFPIFQKGPVSELARYEYLLFGQSLTSANATYSLTFNEYGTLMLTKKGEDPKFFYTASGLSDVRYLFFGRADPHGTTDPTLVLKNGKGDEVWRAPIRAPKERQGNREGAKFRLNEGGDVVISFENDTTWAMSEMPSGKRAFLSNTLNANEFLSAGDRLRSKNSQYECLFQGDGNLVIYQAYPNKVMWASATNQNPPGRVYQQENGPLVIYRHNMAVDWTSRQGGHFQCSTVMEDNGKLVTYAAGDTQVWST